MLDRGARTSPWRHAYGIRYPGDRWGSLPCFVGGSSKVISGSVWFEGCTFKTKNHEPEVGIALFISGHQLLVLLGDLSPVLRSR